VFYINRVKLIKNKVYKSSRFHTEFQPLNIPASKKKKKKKIEEIDYSMKKLIYRMSLDIGIVGSERYIFPFTINFTKKGSSSNL